MTTKLHNLTVAGAALLASAAISQGATIIGGTTGNGDFENITGGSIAHGNGTRIYQNVVGNDATIPGWTAAMTTGTYISFDRRTDWTNTAGQTVANQSFNLNSWSGANLKSDTYTQTLLIGNAITLTYDIASASDGSGVLRHNVDLIFDEGLGSETTVSLFTGDYAYPAGSNQFRTLSYSYTPTAEFSTVGVEFNGRGTTNGAVDMVNRVATTSGLDNVTLTVVPEPSAALLGAFGLLGLLRRRR